jgi:hypothetical protein
MPRKTSTTQPAQPAQRTRKGRKTAGTMMTATEARELLGVTRYKMTRLLDLGPERGGLASHRDPFDLRSKLVARADVERFLRDADRRPAS